MQTNINKGFVLSRMPVDRSLGPIQYMQANNKWGGRNNAVLCWGTTLSSMTLEPGYIYQMFSAEQSKVTTTYITLTEEE